VRAGIAKQAWDFPWSSARAHVLQRDDFLNLALKKPFHVTDWRGYLSESDDAKFLENIKRHEATGRPLGNDDFLRRLEKLTGRAILPRKRGRKKGNGYCVSK